MPTATQILLALLMSTMAATGAPSQGSEPPSFEASARRAATARDAGRTEEAVAAYRRALGIRPDWDEGWWYLGVTLYEAQRCEEADEAFARFLEIKPAAGPGWVIRGVCAYDRGLYPQAIEWLQKGMDLGPGNAELQRAAAARLAFALVKTGQFELAIPALAVVTRIAFDEPGLVEATGLALLHMPLLPSEVPEERRDLVQKLGRAGSLHLANRGDEARKAYEDVVAAYPEEPDVHYAYGVFLLRNEDKEGIPELRKVLELRPDDVMARLEIAFELLLRGDPAGARDEAEKAVALAPTLFAARNALGRALVELGEIDSGIRELEEAVRLAPESREAHFTLAQAYARAGRSEDAAREQAAFAELEEHRRRTPSGAPAAGPSSP
jgi:tetratricopeptide (TPR) repeat protein